MQLTVVAIDTAVSDRYTKLQARPRTSRPAVAVLAHDAMQAAERNSTAYLLSE
jgi:hypothetical protein